jgi:hypothetical protein
MSRPMYENSATLEAERKAIMRYAKAWGCDVTKLPMKYTVDYAITNESGIFAWAEVKCRNVNVNKYTTLMISAEKIWTGLRMSVISGIPFILIIEWLDALGALEVKKWQALDIRIGGRKDRDDWQDMEPMIFFPTNIFDFSKGN